MTPTRRFGQGLIELQQELERAQAETEYLRWEVAGLASSLNSLRELRLIRLFDRYRRLRFRLRQAIRRFPGLGRATLPPQAHPTRPTGSLYDLVLFSVGDWRWRYQRPQHLAVQWARHGYRVFFIAPDFRPWVNPANTRPPRPYSATSIQENLVEVHLAGPEELHPLSKRLLESEVEALAESCLALSADWHIDTAVSLVEFPFWGPLVLRLREQCGWKVVYDCLDRFRGVFPQACSMLSEEPRLVREAELVVTTSRLIWEDLAGQNDNLCLVPNAADIEHFARPPAANPLAGLSHPIIGYMGAIAPWFDVEWVQYAAAQHSEWNIVLVGSGRTSVEALRELPNVHLTGEVPYQELPGYLHAFDVCLIPFRPLPVIAATDPVKFYEYMAAGKPVVGGDLPTLRPYAGLVYMAGDAAGFTDAIAHALAEDSEEKRAARQCFARENSWEARYQTLNEGIEKILAGQASIERAGKISPPQPGPEIARLRPDAVRPAAAGIAPWDGMLVVEGRRFSPTCTVLVDEEPIPTDFLGPAELRGHVPQRMPWEPGCRMVTVVDRETWKQSNGRVFLVERG
ncbi:MAG: glycosyltransferase [Phycisphaerae bacterium]